MSTNRPNQDEPTAEGQLPTSEEVVRRLDRLWVSDQASAGDNLDRSGDLYDLAGKSVGPFRLQRIIGRGAFGVVYLAEDAQLGRKVALKLPRPEMLLDEERLHRFRSEASTAAGLDHPFIVPVYGAEFEGPTPYIVSAYYAGPDLGKWLADQTGPIDFEVAVRFVIRLAEAVEYAHQNGVLHRDLKPGNILLEARTPQAESLDDFNPRLTDFGLAKLVQESLNDTRSSLMIGTPLYMAPEQLFEGTHHDSAATDVYAIGILLFELIAQRTPREDLGYVEGLDKLRNEEAPPLKSFRPTTPAAISTITAKCLERDPVERYSSANALIEDLQRFLTGAPIRAKPVGFKERFVRWTKQPERLTTAGHFSAWYQAMTIVWFAIAFLMFLGLDSLPGEAIQRTMVDMMWLTLLNHLPKAWLGWQLAKAKRWAYWPSAITSLLLLVVFTYSSMQPSYAFEYFYPTQISKIGTFSILILCSSLEVIFHLIAFPAWLRQIREKNNQPPS